MSQRALIEAAEAAYGSERDAAKIVGVTLQQWRAWKAGAPLPAYAQRSLKSMLRRRD
jgi:hypothetical protein